MPSWAAVSAGESTFSKSLSSNLFLTGGYTNTGFDYIWNNQVFDFDSDRYSLGLRTHEPGRLC